MKFEPNSKIRTIPFVKPLRETSFQGLAVGGSKFRSDCWGTFISARCLNSVTLTREDPRRRGAGAPEVLRRETAEEEFRLRRNQPLNMAPSAPKDRYCQADFFAQLFQNKSIFLGSRQMVPSMANSSYFRDPFRDPWKKCVEICI